MKLRKSGLVGSGEGGRRVEVDYVPHPKQVLFHKTAANEVLFGGAAGPGKSRALRAEALRWACKIPGLQIYLFRRTFPELEKNHIIPSQQEFPKELGEYKSQARRWEFFNGSMLHFCHCQYEQDVFQYQGAEIHLLLIDELTTFTKFQYDYLRGRVRCTLDVPSQYRHKVPGIYCASNPGGVGHNFCRARWVDYALPMEMKRAPDAEGGMLRQYIPALLEDNPTLARFDPGYAARLDSLPEPFRTAYRKGDWNIFLGQAFDFSYEHHVVKDFPVPGGAPIYMTYDWGFGAPFSIGWWFVDADGRVIRFSEWYGWDGNENKGLRLTDSEVADKVILREQVLGIHDRVTSRLAGPDCFQKKPDYRGGGQGPSTAELFSLRGLFLTPGDASRVLKIRQFRERMRIPKDDEGRVIDRPMLQVFESCVHFIRTIPAISAAPSNPEEIDTTGEDHCLHGDTKVYSDLGLVPIRKLVGRSGYVLTPDGYKPYGRCWLTRKSADVVEVVLETGRSIRCTKDHKFLNNSARWVEAKDLTSDACHIVIPEITMEVPLSHGTSVKVMSVSDAGPSDVYCLSIPHPHAFIIEGGLVSHNCFDDSCHICMARPISHDARQLVQRPMADVLIDAVEKPSSTDDYDDYYAREAAAFNASLLGDDRARRMDMIYDLA